MLSVIEKEFDQFVNWDLKSERFKGQQSDEQEGHSFFPFLIPLKDRAYFCRVALNC